MNTAANMILASTGTMIGRANGYDYLHIIEHSKDVACDGFELMMLPAWYGRLPEIASAIVKAGIYTPVIHFDKMIGVMLAEMPDDTAEAVKLFRKNAEMAKSVGAAKAVFHLWGGAKSDSAIDSAIELLSYFYEICADNGVTLMVENIPCVYSDPLAIWRKILLIYPDAKFTFDTRFGAFHHQYKEIFRSGLWQDHVCHIHVSDYGGHANEWGLIRPILHPGEGTIDFDDLFGNMPYYNGAVTLESPVLSDDGKIDVSKLNNSLNYLRKITSEYKKIPD